MRRGSEPAKRWGLKLNLNLNLNLRRRRRRQLSRLAPLSHSIKRKLTPRPHDKGLAAHADDQPPAATSTKTGQLSSGPAQTLARPETSDGHHTCAPNKYIRPAGTGASGRSADGGAGGVERFFIVSVCRPNERRAAPPAHKQEQPDDTRGKVSGRAFERSQFDIPETEFWD